LFNESKFDEAFKYLEEEKFIEQIDAYNVAKFLNTPGLDKVSFFHLFLSDLPQTILGVYLCKRKPFNESVLDEYFGLFQYSNINFVDCVRQLLESFRIPGEAQIMERLMDVFSKHYQQRADKEQKEIFLDLDAVYLAAFSIPFLNTQLYHKNIKEERRITKVSVFFPTPLSSPFSNNI